MESGAAFEPQVLVRGVETALRRQLREPRGEPFDLVFADPPYRFSGYRGLIEGVAPLLARDGELVVEAAARGSELPEEAADLALFDRRAYGESALVRYQSVAR